ncbi:MAG: hypothetical protein WC383_08915 [Gammaproteobacteria bacterium]
MQDLILFSGFVLRSHPQTSHRPAKINLFPIPGRVNVFVVCAGEYVGLEKIDDGIWNVYFGLPVHRDIVDPGSTTA